MELTVEWPIDSTTCISLYPTLGDFYLTDGAGSRQSRIYLGDVSAVANVTASNVLALLAGLSAGFLVAIATDGNGVGSPSEFSPEVIAGDPDSIFASGFEIPWSPIPE